MKTNLPEFLLVRSLRCKFESQGLLVQGALLRHYFSSSNYFHSSIQYKVFQLSTVIPSSYIRLPLSLLPSPSSLPSSSCSPFISKQRRQKTESLCISYRFCNSPIYFALVRRKEIGFLHKKRHVLLQTNPDRHGQRSLLNICYLPDPLPLFSLYISFKHLERFLVNI
jgi:hypothetical protein